MPRRKPPDALRPSNISEYLNGHGPDACIGPVVSPESLFQVWENIFQEQ